MDGSGAQDDTVDPGIEQAVSASGVAHPTAALHGAPQPGDARHVRKVDRIAATRAVEIDDVEARGAGVDPAPGRRDGVTVEDGFAVVAPLEQPHAAAATDVDGGYDLHGVSPIRRPRRARRGGS